MPIDCRDRVPVIDFDNPAVAATISSIGDDSGRGRVDRRHIGSRQIEPCMKRRPSIERIAPRPEAALEPKILERHRQRQRLDQTAYPFELVRFDATKRAFPRWHEGTACGPVQTELREHALDIEPRRCQYARELAPRAHARGLLEAAPWDFGTKFTHRFSDAVRDNAQAFKRREL